MQAARRRRQPDGLRAARRGGRARPASSRPWPRSPSSVASSSTGSSRRRPAGSARRCATAATTSCTTSATATSPPTARACCTSRGKAAPTPTVDGTELANLLADQTSLRLVVLNSCEGARTTLTDPYAGVATTLVQLGVPAVVAMQFEISDEAAILFAEELYTNLIGRQDPIDAAVAEARKAIYIELGTVEWATPVLFMGDVDVELFRFEVAAAPLPPPPPPSAPLAPAGSRTATVAGHGERRRRRDRGRPRAGRRLVALRRPAPPVADDEDHHRRRRRAGAALRHRLLLLLHRRADLAERRLPVRATSPATDPPATAAEAAADRRAAAAVDVGPATFAGSIDEPDGVDDAPADADRRTDRLRAPGPASAPRPSTTTWRHPSGSQLGGSPYVCNDIGRSWRPRPARTSWRWRASPGAPVRTASRWRPCRPIDRRRSRPVSR